MWCQVTPRPTLVCGLRRRAGGAAQQRPPLRWPRRQGGHRRAASGPGHSPRRDRFGTCDLAKFLCTCWCVCCARVARCGCERQGGGRRACVRARVVCLWLEVACAAGKSGQATRGSASLDVRDRAKNPGKTECLARPQEAWNEMKPTRNFRSACGVLAAKATVNTKKIAGGRRSENGQSLASTWWSPVQLRNLRLCARKSLNLVRSFDPIST